MDPVGSSDSATSSTAASLNNKRRLGSTSSGGSDRAVGFPSGSGPPKADISALTSSLFQKTAEYLEGELEGTADEYRLLENMNRTTSQRYADMKQVTSNISKSMDNFTEKYQNLEPYLEQVEEIDASSRRLEEAAYALDAYVKSLEARFKLLEKR